MFSCVQMIRRRGLSHAGRLSRVLTLGLALAGAASFGGSFQDWSLRHPRVTQESLQKVSYAQDRFVALGAAGSILTSSNAVDWEVSPSGVNGTLYGLAYGNGRWVAVGGVQTWLPTIGYTNYALISISEDGRTWHGLTNTTTGAYLTAVAFGQGRFVATGGSYAWTSIDGTKWVRQEQIGTVYYSRWVSDASTVAYGLRAFLAVGGGFYQTGPYTGSYRYAAWSGDGRQWTNLISNSDPPLAHLTASGDRFVALGPPTVFIPGTNGTWQIQTNASVPGFDLAFGDGLFFTGSAESPDGLSWTVVPSHTEVPFFPVGPAWVPQSLAFGQGKWVTVGTGGLIGVSTNRVDWFYPTIAAGVPLTSLCQGPDLLLAVGGAPNFDPNGPIQGVVLTSSDGLIWVNRPVPARARLNSVIYAAGLYVAVGGDSQVKDSGVILVSTNGIDWSERPFSPRTPLTKVVFGNGVFAATGSYRHTDYPSFMTTAQGLLLKSSNGLDWTNQILTADASYEDIVFGNGQFVLRGKNTAPVGWPFPSDGVYASTNLADWSQPLTALHMGNLAFVDGQFRLAAWGGPGGSVPGVFSSIDGNDWLLIPTDLEQPSRMTFAQSTYYGVNGTNVLVSGDGIVWTVAKTWPVPLNDVAPVNGTLFMVGDQGTIVQSGPVGPFLSITGPSDSTPGKVQLKLRSDPGEVVTIESSPDLSNWSDWLQTTNVTGVLSISDNIGAGAKYYRARLVQ
jgi:hypothetical protein